MAVGYFALLGAECKNALYGPECNGGRRAASAHVAADHDVRSAAGRRARTRRVHDGRAGRRRRCLAPHPLQLLPGQARRRARGDAHARRTSRPRGVPSPAPAATSSRTWACLGPRAPEGQDLEREELARGPRGSCPSPGSWPRPTSGSRRSAPRSWRRSVRREGAAFDERQAQVAVGLLGAVRHRLEASSPTATHARWPSLRRGLRAARALFA